MWKFYKSILGSALKEFWAATDGVLSGIAVLSFFAILLSRKYGEHIVTTWNGISPWWSVIPIGLLVSWRLLKANYMQFASIKAERDALLGTTVLAEEDPKVYLEVLNNNIVTPSIVFQVGNKGQRVNLAHAITVQPIASLPSVSFDVIDYLDMAGHAPLVPHVNDAPTPFGRSDVLVALRKAWEAVSAEKGRVDVTFEFEMTLDYEDVNRIKKFETEVKLLYFPLRDMNRSATRISGSDQDIIKVIENRPRRKA